ncbi:hypothetical protein [Polaromonas sp. CG9_12]|nr:hypothetical protein [Polaromonas sp. CG9_12]
MMFIAHTISTYSQSFKMVCPAAYALTVKKPTLNTQLTLF